jgi:Holliday junction resolvase RusA-like endonuclease
MYNGWVTLAMSLIHGLNETIRQKLSLQELIFYGKIAVERNYSKKNNRPLYKNRGTGRSFIGKSPELKAAENHLVRQLRILRDKQGITQPYKGAVWLMLQFGCANYFTVRGSVSRQIGDLSNMIELPQDALQEAGIIENDAQVHSLDLSRRIPSDENYVEIFLMRFTEDLSAPSSTSSHKNTK